MKKLALVFILMILATLIFATKVDLCLIGTAEDAQGQKLLKKYKQALLDTNEIAIVDSLDNGVFLITYITLDPLKNSLIGTDIGTVYALTCSYFSDGYPITIDTIVGTCLYKDAQDDAVDLMVENTIKMLNEGIEGYPELFEVDGDN